VNPFQRQLAEQTQRQVGELQSGLANTLAQLGSALQQAEINRDRELAQIDFDAVDFRSDVGRLLGA
jgi:phosphoribosylamine-glycine ligase